ncbi:hypothetical protein HZC35_06580 [Candidatus Saganbacteria bacterium]|nr:hypothetical protein [Candidatus Saganbacteria bacterium]
MKPRINSRLNLTANLFAGLLVLTLASQSFANFGARPLGMGGAFVAISDDANAAWWNPAGLARNPGVDITGTTVISNRNACLGDNLLALKMNFETELNPFLWVAGIGVVSLVALEGAKYLSDQGVLKKNWGRSTEKVDQTESPAEKVKEGGTEKTVAVGQKIKEKAAQVTEQALSSTASTAKEVARHTSVNVYWGPWAYPYYYRDYHRPTYWDERPAEEEYSPQGKAQFAGGLSWLTDNNSVQDQKTNYYTLTLATGYEERVALGSNLNFYDIKIPSVNLKGYGAGIDLGLLLRPVDQLAFGAVAKEILTTDIHFENGTNLTYRMSINCGLAVTPIDELTVAADIQNIFRQSGKPQTNHYGAEFRPFPGLALRAGLNDGSKTAGASIMINQVILDYAYLGGNFNRTQIAGLTWRL